MTPQEQVLQSIFRTKPDASKIKAIGEWFAGTANQKGHYEGIGIFSSLFDLYLHNGGNNENKPIIKIQDINQGINQNTTFIGDLQEISQSIDQNKRDVIYIRRRPVELRQRENHWVIFYFFVDKGKKKNLLFIDTQNTNIGQQSKFQKDIESFKTEQNFNVCVLDISIQKDDNSCGLIASEITRMLYNNHESVKENLSKCQVQDREKVELSSLPLGNEFQRLKSAYATKGNVNYDGKDEKFHAADIRAAHFATALAIGENNVNRKLSNQPISLNNKRVEKLVKDIRLAFIGNPNSTELFKKIVLKDETTSKANSDLGYSSSSEPNSPQLERNHLLETPQTSSSQNVNLESKIKKQDQTIKQLEEALEHFINIASENDEKLQNKAQQLSESEGNVKQLTQNFDALQKEIENYKRTVNNLNAQLTTKDQELNDAKQNLNEVTQLTEENSPQLERNHLLKTPQTSSGQSSDFKKEIEKKDKKIKELEELLNKKNADLSKIEKEKNEAFDRASKSAQKLEQTKQQLSESEENVKQLTRNFDALQKEIENYKRTVNNLNAQLTTKDQELNDVKQNLNEVTQLTEENVRLRAQNQDLNNKNKKFSEASAQDRKQSNYASVAFMVAGTFAVVASLTMPYLAVCTTLAIAASIFFAVGCYSLYKANTTLSNAEVNQATSSAGLTATQQPSGF
ncbi:MAG: hypothetical protein LBU02_01850 [Rickettsiales bacterium]|jgi:uncharacterized coiled-coil DUF342 family protein|nr:hypothetical protein [Rickettsiales bacterium]